MSHKCLNCTTELVFNENWSASRKKNRHYCCTPCANRISSEWHKSRRKDVLYLIVHPTESEFVKVGVTNNPPHKLASYNYTSPTSAFSFTKMYELPNTHEVEKMVLDYFIDQRHFSNTGKGSKKRDWVKAPLSDILSYIDSIIPQVGVTHV